MEIPKDDFILLSLVNTKLRNDYSSFEELCGEEGILPSEISDRLSRLGYVYDEKLNAFVRE